MTRATTDTFILTMPLRYESWQRDRLDKIFSIAGNIYNNLVSDRKKTLDQLERTVAWRRNQAAIRQAYESGTTKDDGVRMFYQERNDMLKASGFTEYAFQARVQRWRRPYSHLVGTHVAQKLASAVWNQFESYLFGDGKRISFRRWTEFVSIEGKTNNACIRYRDGMVYIGKKLGIPVMPPRNDYEEVALSCRVKYCRIVRIPWKHGQWLYRLQLVLEGTPPVKTDKTGKDRYPVGSGRVGIDIGTQTVAAVGDDAASLYELAPDADLPEKRLHQTLRKMDRSRRATNSDFFDQLTGEVIRKDKLLPGYLDKNGRRKWGESKEYKKLSGQRRYLYAKLARIRKCGHQAMANRFLSYGSMFFVETMNFKGLAKRAKRQEPEPGKREKRRKRFGKSIGNKAPAMFVDILEQKVKGKGGSFYRIKTWSAKASQYDHTDGTYRKKGLSKRWADLSDGHRVQRDLYSAYLLKNTNDTLDGFIQKAVEDGFVMFLKIHDEEIERLAHVRMPASAGVRYIKVVYEQDGQAITA